MSYSVEKLQPEGDDDVSEKALKAESAATYGSLGFAYGGSNDLLQSQFTLNTKNEKRHQITLLQVAFSN